jgi:CheY-like chemotaxis protein
MYKVKTSDPNQKYRENIRKLKLLIVDDDDGARESLISIIKTRGHDITALDEGMKCVNRCSENIFDVIFMDYHINDIDQEIGELNGTDVTKLVRDCFDAESSIYAYTGDNTTHAIKQFKDNKMKGAFIKPVDPSLVLDFLRIIEVNKNDHTKLSRLAMKNKNFMYFDKQPSKIFDKN